MAVGSWRFGWICNWCDGCCFHRVSNSCSRRSECYSGGSDDKDSSSMKLFGGSSDKKVMIQCPYATEGSKDFCNPKKPYMLNMNSPDFKELMEAHVNEHIQRDSSLFGLTIKRYGCPICPWESKPFQSNNAITLKALGREEMEAMIDLEDHITGNSERVGNLNQSLELMKGMRKMADAEQDLEKRDAMLQQLTELGDEKT